MFPFLPTEKPGVSRSTIKAVNPRMPADFLCWQKRYRYPDIPPLVMKHFVPLSLNTHIPLLR